MNKLPVETVAVYAGSFDPITIGHVDIIERALKIFSRLHVAVAGSTPKALLFSLEERVDMVKAAVFELAESERARIEVEGFNGLLVDYVRSIRAVSIVRGLRAVSDYEYEAQMALINRTLAPEIETVFLVTSPHCSFVSSSVVKTIAHNGGDASPLVPAAVARKLETKSQ